MDDFISVITQTADRVNGEEPAAKGGSEALFSPSLPATCFPNGSSLACCWDAIWCIRWGRRWGVNASKWA
ncbi:hypothetical protein UA70_23215 [Raoultella planticola]|nr:hypothetical protein UA70_23215 [Raoultella planticola]